MRTPPAVKFLNGGNADYVGAIPANVANFADESMTAREQLHASYPHGGGWNPFNGFSLGADDSLTYPGDPPLVPRAEVLLGTEDRVLVYDHAWVAIISPDRKVEVCRMD